MTILNDVLKKYQDSVNRVIDECEVFYAFTDKQFEEGLAKVRSTDSKATVIKLGGGVFIPTRNIDKYYDGLATCKENFKSIIDHYNLHDQYIEYQLCNYESYYTGDIEYAFGSMIGDYTISRVLEVFNKNKHLHYND